MEMEKRDEVGRGDGGGGRLGEYPTYLPTYLGM